MSVIAGKIAWLLLSPGSVLFGLLILALLLSWGQRTRRWGMRLGIPVLAIIAVLGVMPSFDWMVRPLEDYYPVPKLPSAVDGIIVLGGAELPETSSFRRQPQLNASAERLIAFASLARRYPAARLVFSGRGVWRHADSYSEADVARAALAEMGLDTSRVAFENKSRNTAENAINSQALMHPQPGQVWLLVTSAAHMPRAVNCFRAIGWNVLPYPVDYRTGEAPDGFVFEPRVALGSLDRSIKEWVGLLAYRLLGHTREFLPPRILTPVNPQDARG